MPTHNPIAPSLTLVGHGVISSLLATHALHADIAYQQLSRTQAPPRNVAWLDGQHYGLATPVPIDGLSTEPVFHGLVIVPTKAYQVDNALQWLQGKLAQDTVLLLLHNGLGTATLATTLFPDHTILLGTTSMAGYLRDNTIMHTAFGHTQYGVIQDRGLPQLIQDYLTHLFPAQTFADDIYPALYTKLAVNCAINPLTAIHNIQNGVLAQPQYAADIECIVQEVVHIATCNGVALSTRQTLATVQRVIVDTATNYSSMHQDIKHSRPTEVDFINGFVVREANKYGVQVPQNERLLKHIHMLEGRL
jgi:2-dehydropantoate 2-reductase